VALRSGQWCLVAVALLALAALAPRPVAAQSGHATVIDGDTLEVEGVRVRLWGIDAPETRQTCSTAGATYPCGRHATGHLRLLVSDREVRCEPRARDRWGRVVAVCRAGGLDLGAAMVRDGWALAFVRYSRDYMLEEATAYGARRGVWAGTFVAPWHWRAMAKKGSG
jgi:endonuclease YncB( thermonuclease family)